MLDRSQTENLFTDTQSQETGETASSPPAPELPRPQRRHRTARPLPERGRRVARTSETDRLEADLAGELGSWPAHLPRLRSGKRVAPLLVLLAILIANQAGCNHASRTAHGPASAPALSPPSTAPKIVATAQPPRKRSGSLRAAGATRDGVRRRRLSATTSALRSDAAHAPVSVEPPRNVTGRVLPAPSSRATTRSPAAPGGGEEFGFER